MADTNTSMASEAPRAALSSENTDAAASESPPSPAAAPSQPTTPASRSQPSSQSSTRSLAQRRIDNILDEARQRKVALAGSTSLAAAAVGMPYTQTRSQQESLGLSENDGVSYADHGESSADESTVIMRREEAKKSSYQATGNLRSRNSASTVSLRRSGDRRCEPHVAAEDNGELHDESWWQKQLAKYGSIELENKGSVARDHLALERTYLAWLRTSLAFASIGIAITQLFRLNTSISNDTGSGSDPYQHLRQLGKPLGATFLGISIVVLFIGFHRYFESQHWIIRGKFPASRGSIALISAIAFALMVTSLVVVLVIEPGAYEKKR